VPDGTMGEVADFRFYERKGFAGPQKRQDSRKDDNKNGTKQRMLSF
jgi:hypothetical protein